MKARKCIHNIELFRFSHFDKKNIFKIANIDVLGGNATVERNKQR
jgi:hypothetical protein